MRATPGAEIGAGDSGITTATGDGDGEGEGEGDEFGDGEALGLAEAAGEEA
jgi:hypothetical protein